VNVTTELQKAITAIRAGKKSDARRLLAHIIKADHKNVQAWFLLSYVVETKGQRVDCLRKVLALEPRHKVAKKWLTALNAVAGPGEQIVDVRPNKETVQQAKVFESTPSLSNVALPKPVTHLPTKSSKVSWLDIAPDKPTGALISEKSDPPYQFSTKFSLLTGQ
jgi:hypothetical protein